MTHITSSEYATIVKALASFAPYLPKSVEGDYGMGIAIYMPGQKDSALTIPYALIRQAVKISEVSKLLSNLSTS